MTSSIKPHLSIVNLQEFFYGFKNLTTLQAKQVR